VEIRADVILRRARDLKDRQDLQSFCVIL